MNKSKPEKRRLNHPFLKEGPRVHFEHLEYSNPDTKEEVGRLYYQSKPFTGIAWEEYAGYLCEQTFKMGMLTGRSVRFYPSGVMMEEATYLEGKMVGERYQWHIKGQLKLYGKYSPSGQPELIRQYNEIGILVSEHQEIPEYHERYWDKNGNLYFGITAESGELFNSFGVCLIRDYYQGPPVNRRPSDYQDEAIYQSIEDLLIIQDDRIWYAFNRWLAIRLDQKVERARLLLMNLMKHPRPEVVRDAMNIVVKRGYQDVLLVIQSLLDDRREITSAEGDVQTRICDLAEVAIISLTGKGDIADTLARQYQDRKRREEEMEERLMRVRQNWPVVEAKYRFTDFENEEVNHEQFNYYYTYKVGDFYYLAYYQTDRSIPPDSILIRYRKKKPEEYILV